VTDIEPVENVQQLARDLDIAIRAVARQMHIAWEALVALVNEAKATDIHVTLGFPSWTAYIADALDGQWRIERDKRREVVKFLAAQGMSQRVIVKATGWGKGTVHRELAGAPLGQVITGLDGKSYPRPEPEAPTGAPDQESDEESDEEFLARLQNEREANRNEDGSVTFTLPATPEAADEMMQELSDDLERIHQMQFEIELARYNTEPDGTATKCAYQLGLWTRHRRRWGLWIYEELGSIEEFARLANTSVDSLRELLFDENEDEDEFDEEEEM
jgi:hypothetical protein